MFVVALACISKHLWRGNRSKGRAMFVLIVGLEKEAQSTRLCSVLSLKNP